MNESVEMYYEKLGLDSHERVVVDTNVWLDRNITSVIESFENKVLFIIPHMVLKEIDKFKKGVETINENAREANRFLNKLREQGAKDYDDWKTVYSYDDEKYLFYIDIEESDLDLTKPDNKIIFSARNNEADFYSQDLNALVVADALGVRTKNFSPEDVDVNELYTGHGEYYATMDEYLQFQDSPIEVPHNEFLENQFVVVKYAGQPDLEGIYDAAAEWVRPLERNYRAITIEPKFDARKQDINEQKMFMHLLMDEGISMVTGLGPSGCGKTLLSLAAALQQVNEGKYSRVVVMRPLTAVGKDIGYLPGDKAEKLESWMASTYDALDVILENYIPKDGYKDGFDFSVQDKVRSLREENLLELEAMTYIRGRSLSRQIMIVDDAQNLTRQEAATIVTRIGEGSKLILLGDLSEKQIDNPRLTPRSNGLAYVIDRMKGQEIVGHLTLKNVVRSKLAQLGVDLL